ncbi:MAG: BMP family ABC transporter substrate-binding protein, partial [Blautia massiliensis (ex Durand et al. 2017)]
MKKFLALAMAGSMAFSLAACGNSASTSASASDSASTATSSATSEEAAVSEITGIAQVCDVGTIDDESFNQGCWEAVEAFGEANGIDVEYY